jgi:hypothetical protein
MRLATVAELKSDLARSKTAGQNAEFVQIPQNLNSSYFLFTEQEEASPASMISSQNLRRRGIPSSQATASEQDTELFKRSHRRKSR